MRLAARIVDWLSHSSANVSPAIGLMRTKAGTWLNLLVEAEVQAVDAGAMRGWSQTAILICLQITGRSNC